MEFRTEIERNSYIYGGGLFSKLLPHWGDNTEHRCPVCGGTAHIYTTDAGRRYRCSNDGCKTHGKSLNPLELVMIRDGIASPHRAIVKVCGAYDLTIKENAWIEQQKADLSDVLAKVYGETPTDLLPTAVKLVGTGCRTLDGIIRIAQQHISPEHENEDGNIIFFGSYREIARASGAMVTEVQRQAAALAYLGIVDRLQDADIPADMLIEAKRQQAQACEGTGRKQFRTTFWSLRPWNPDHMREIEEAARRWKENGYKKSSFDRDALLAAEGRAMADKIFPAGEGNARSHKRETLDNLLTDIICGQIAADGWTDDDKILSGCSRIYRKDLENALAADWSGIAAANGLRKIGNNRTNRDRYGYTGSRRKFITIGE